MKYLGILCLVLAILLVWIATSFAAPFLVCDPQEGVETYNVYQDGVLVAENVSAQADGSLRYDLQGVTPGAYNWTANACNVWGCSESSDPFVSPAGAVKPSGLKLIK